MPQRGAAEFLYERPQPSQPLDTRGENKQANKKNPNQPTKQKTQEFPGKEVLNDQIHFYFSFSLCYTGKK